MSDCANCGHSHAYDGPFKPYKPVGTPCWKCGCDTYAPGKCRGHWTTGIQNTANQDDHYCMKADGHDGRHVCECGDRRKIRAT